MIENGIMLVGEAWGKEEAEEGKPFVGPSGRLLNRMLSEVGIARSECYVTNVFNLQPEPTNDVTNLCGPKAESIVGYPSIQQGKYVHRKYEGELLRLYGEIRLQHPRLVVALGATAAWALLGSSGIKRVRGAPSALAGRARQEVGFDVKVLPTYHPANIMREWTNRPIVIADLEKAKRESAFPELRRPRREIWVEPTIADLARFEHDYINGSIDLSVDIETAGDQITCVGFAPTVDRAIVVPFVNPLAPDGNYWKSINEELQAWDYVRRWCAMRKAVIGQNFNYDMHRLWRTMGISFPQMDQDDTMLLHHALQPEMEKGLGFLATVYTDELPWKFMRTKHETLKKED